MRLMCLVIGDWNDWTYLDDGTRTAHKAHRCVECGRRIDAGERYEYVAGVVDGRAATTKTCAHCCATVTLGSRLTGCPAQWYAAALWDPDEGVGFVADILTHDLPRAQRLRMLRCVAAARRLWRWRDGSLMPLPTIPERTAR